MLDLLGGGNSKICSPLYLGKIPILTNIFQMMGWSHQPGLLDRTHFTVSPLSPEDSRWTSVLNFNWADISFGCNTLPETVCSALKINGRWNVVLGPVLFLLMDEFLHHLWTYKRPCSLNNGINCQPQLVSLPDVWTIKSVSFQPRGFESPTGLRPHPSPQRLAAKIAKICSVSGRRSLTSRRKGDSSRCKWAPGWIHVLFLRHPNINLHKYIPPEDDVLDMFLQNDDFQEVFKDE